MRVVGNTRTGKYAPVKPRELFPLFSTLNSRIVKNVSSSECEEELVRVVLGITKKVHERKSELARLKALDCGKPLDEASWGMDDVVGCFEYCADLAVIYFSS
ncbi:hypothetical protein C5167_037737 [Papaver somniferum]|uniref:Uncharacterized protein n=1 Tax=Papaver somniferum TaxID=3469 RepID=A0A4Y7IB96_PAPSO|nr:hypothetical protein C5167_037737 [Papaver somniferum]